MKKENCDLCGSSVVEGDFGESKYVCQNHNCERSNPNWAAEERRKKIKPYIDRMDNLKTFDGGTIDFYDARWVGDGSAEIILDNGKAFECHVKNDQFEPFDNKYFNELNINISKSQILQIKSNMLELIKIRDELYKINM